MQTISCILQMHSLTLHKAHNLLWTHSVLYKIPPNSEQCIPSTAYRKCILHTAYIAPHSPAYAPDPPEAEHSLHQTAFRRFRRRTFTQNILSNVTLYFGFVNCICHQLFGVVCSQGNLSNLGGLFLFYFTGVWWSAMAPPVTTLQVNNLQNVQKS